MREPHAVILGASSTRYTCPMHPDDVQELLAGFGYRTEADKVDRVARGQGIADLAVGLDAADTRPLPGARTHHDHGSLARIGRDSRRRKNARQCIVDRSQQ